MAAQTFTVTNLSDSPIVLDQIIFNTPAGIRHVANLVNFGGTAYFTDAEFLVTNPNLDPNQSKTFTVDHTYISGPIGVKSGTIVVSSTSGKTFTICTNIAVGTTSVSSGTPTPAPVPVPSPTPTPVPSPTPTPVPSPTATPEYVLTTDAPFLTANEGTTVRINLSTTNVQPGTVIPYTIAGSQLISGTFGPSDINIPVNGSFVLDSDGKAFVDIGLVNDTSTSSDKFMTLTLDNIQPEVSIGIVINDITG